jgi:Arc/MetJ-type ribon-helix-helix transcriptional regulator
MSYPFPIDIQHLVVERMASGRYASEDDLLREALASLSESEHDLEAIEAAIAEWRAGDEGLPLDDAFDALRD